MLTNDTWFMYEEGKSKILNADGFGSLNAEGDAAPEVAASESAAPVAKTLLEKIEEECAHPAGLLCRKNTNRPICQGRIKRCINQKLKQHEKAASVELDSGTAAATKAALVDETAKPSGKSSTGMADDGGDNTVMYVGAGVGLLVLGLAAVMILKKRGGAVAAAPATN